MTAVIQPQFTELSMFSKCQMLPRLFLAGVIVFAGTLSICLLAGIDRGTARHGSISLRIGHRSKKVEHDWTGPSNEEFVRLVRDLAETGIEQSAEGIGVDNLEDGLQQILDGKLDPRALKIKEEYLRHRACDDF